MQIPHAFFERKAAEIGFQLPKPGDYAVGALFMPKETAWRKVIKSIIADQIKDEGLMLLGWRDVPIRQFLARRNRQADRARPHAGVHRPRRAYQERATSSSAGSISCASRFRRRSISAATAASPAIIRCRCRAAPWSTRACSSPTSSANIIPTCSEPDFESALALVHQRFSTNTFPTWSLAHPYRMIAHNGEINTLRGNVNWMAARQASVHSELYGKDISRLWPISYEGQSDTACFDNAPRIPGAGRLLAAARGDDDDSGSLGRQSADG